MSPKYNKFQRWMRRDFMVMGNIGNQKVMSSILYSKGNKRALKTRKKHYKKRFK